MRMPAVYRNGSISIQPKPANVADRPDRPGFNVWRMTQPQWACANGGDEERRAPTERRAGGGRKPVRHRMPSCRSWVPPGPCDGTAPIRSDAFRNWRLRSRPAANARTATSSPPGPEISPRALRRFLVRVLADADRVPIGAERFQARHSSRSSAECVRLQDDKSQARNPRFSAGFPLVPPKAQAPRCRGGRGQTMPKDHHKPDERRMVMMIIIHPESLAKGIP